METRRSKLKSHLVALNEQYAAWIQKELREHPLELWIDGAQQYVQHAEKLLNDFDDVLSAPDSPKTGSVAKSEAREPSFKFSQQPAEKRQKGNGVSEGLEAFANGAKNPSAEAVNSELPSSAGKPSNANQDKESNGAANSIFGGDSRLGGAKDAKPAPIFSWNTNAPSTNSKPFTFGLPAKANGLLEGSEAPASTSGRAEPAESFLSAWKTDQNASTSQPLFGIQQQSSKGFGTSDSSKPPSFGQTSIGQPAAAPFSFGKPPAAPFSLGQSSTVPFAFGQSSAVPFSFGATSSDDKKEEAKPFMGNAQSSASFGGFSFLSKTKPTNGVKAEEEENGEGDADEGTQEEDDNPIARQDDSAEVMFEAKGNLHIQSNDGDKVWENRGKGNLTIRKTLKDSGRPFIVFTSNTGRVWLNASIHSGLKPIEKDKNRVMMTLFWAEEGAENKGRCVLAKLTNAENLQEFLSVIAKLEQQ